MNNSDPYQKLLFAVWTQALNDINRLFLLEEEVISFTNPDKEQAVRENAEDALRWIKHDECHTFELIADLFDIPIDIFRSKTLRIIDENQEKIKKRSQTTNRYMYATVSRFRNYEEAFKRTSVQAHISKKDTTSGN